MSFFKPNIEMRGRIARAVCGLLCLSGAFFLKDHTVTAVACAGSGLFMLFEAVRGWCVARACGLKTPM